MPLTVMPVFPVDTVPVWVGVVGEEEPPQPATVPMTSSTATTSTAHLLIFSADNEAGASAYSDALSGVDVDDQVGSKGVP